MSKTVLLLKCAVFSERTLINLRAFLQLGSTEFYYVIAAILYTLDKSNKDKVFGGEQIAKVYSILIRRKLRDYRQLKIKLSRLQQMGYFDIMFVKKEASGYMTYYTINEEKMNYFISAFAAFINQEMRVFSEVDNFMPESVEKLAKKDVLKHIKTLRSFFKIK